MENYEHEIDYLRQLVNKDDIVLSMLQKREINDWNRLCSAMDWAQMGFLRLQSGYNSDFRNYRLYDYVSAIDIILDSLKLIGEIFGENVKNPLEQTTYIKGLDIFDKGNDSSNIKRLRALFGAHPIDLKNGYGKKTKKYYCSWPGNIASETEVSLFIYSEEQDVDSFIIRIEMTNLKKIIEELRNYIHNLCIEIKVATSKYIEQSIVNVKLTGNHIEDIDQMIEQTEEVFYDKGLYSEIEQLKELYRTPLYMTNGEQITNRYMELTSKELEKYRKFLLTLDFDEDDSLIYLANSNFIAKIGIDTYEYGKIYCLSDDYWNFIDARYISDIAEVLDLNFDSKMSLLEKRNAILIVLYLLEYDNKFSSNLIYPAI